MSTATPKSGTASRQATGSVRPATSAGRPRLGGDLRRARSGVGGRPRAIQGAGEIGRAVAVRAGGRPSASRRRRGAARTSPSPPGPRSAAGSTTRGRASPARSPRPSRPSRRQRAGHRVERLAVVVGGLPGLGLHAEAGLALRHRRPVGGERQVVGEAVAAGGEPQPGQRVARRAGRRSCSSRRSRPRNGVGRRPRPGRRRRGRRSRRSGASSARGQRRVRHPDLAVRPAGLVGARAPSPGGTASTARRSRRRRRRSGWRSGTTTRCGSPGARPWSRGKASAAGAVTGAKPSAASAEPGVALRQRRPPAGTAAGATTLAFIAEAPAAARSGERARAAAAPARAPPAPRWRAPAPTSAAHCPGSSSTGSRQPKARTLTTAVSTQASASPSGSASSAVSAASAERPAELDRAPAGAGSAPSPRAAPAAPAARPTASAGWSGARSPATASVSALSATVTAKVLSKMPPRHRLQRRAGRRPGRRGSAKAARRSAASRGAASGGDPHRHAPPLGVAASARRARRRATITWPSALP